MLGLPARAAPPSPDPGDEAGSGSACGSAHAGWCGSGSRRVGLGWLGPGGAGGAWVACAGWYGSARAGWGWGWVRTGCWSGAGDSVGRFGAGLRSPSPCRSARWRPGAPPAPGPGRAPPAAGRSAGPRWHCRPCAEPAAWGRARLRRARRTRGTRGSPRTRGTHGIGSGRANETVNGLAYATRGRAAFRGGRPAGLRVNGVGGARRDERAVDTDDRKIPSRSAFRNLCHRDHRTKFNDRGVQGISGVLPSDEEVFRRRRRSPRCPALTASTARVHGVHANRLRSRAG